ncbi:MAG: DNA polymerase III subunit epsilon, partial [Filomicrobium sp.]
RQASMELAQGPDGAGSSGARNAPVLQRSNPLPTRLSEAEAKAHSDFVETLGETALWRRYL